MGQCQQVACEFHAVDERSPVTFTHCPCQNNLRRGTRMFSRNACNHFIFQRFYRMPASYKGDMDTVRFRPVNHDSADTEIAQSGWWRYCVRHRGSSAFHQRNGEV